MLRFEFDNIILFGRVCLDLIKLDVVALLVADLPIALNSFMPWPCDKILEVEAF